MTFEEFKDCFSKVEIIDENSGTYTFLVEVGYRKLTYNFFIDKLQYIEYGTITGEVKRLRFADLIGIDDDDYCLTRTIRYENFLNIVKYYYKKVVCCTVDGQVIDLNKEDLHNYDLFYLNGDPWHFISDNKMSPIREETSRFKVDINYPSINYIKNLFK